MPPSIYFVTLEDEIDDQIINVFGPNFNYEIVHITVNDYQGSETYAMFEKIKDIARNTTSFPIVTDVTSVCFKALNGLPGTLISSFASKLTSEELFKLLEAWEDKSARAVYMLGFMETPHSEVITFHGGLSGVMVHPSNPHYYGWKACFQPDGFSQPYAELPKDIQVDISGWKEAMTALKSHLVLRGLV